MLRIIVRKNYMQEQTHIAQLVSRGVAGGSTSTSMPNVLMCNRIDLGKKIRLEDKHHQQDLQV